MYVAFFPVLKLGVGVFIFDKVFSFPWLSLCTLGNS